MTMQLQKKLYTLLEEPHKSKSSLYLNMFIYFLIIVSILNLMLSTVSIYQEKYGYIFEITRNIIMPLFIIEYILRFYASGTLEKYRGFQGKVRYFFSFYALIDLVSILPYILINIGFNSTFVRSLRLLRIFRLFRMKKYALFIQLMKQIMSNIKEELLVLVFFIAVILVILSFIMFQVEHDAQPDAFSNIFQTLWWSVATLTTVGYGDIYPITPMGKLLTSAIAILSIGFIAIPGGMFASEFMSALNTVKKKKELYIGVMSGTSLDGVDVALCEIDEYSCSLLHSKEYPFDETLKEDILSTISGTTTLENVGILDHKLGVLFADALSNFLTEFSLDTHKIEAIGLHGQTLWHAPNSETPFSMQLGDANIVATQTGIQTIADFRRMDIANGGEGAPFAPVFHQFLFGNLKGNNALINIGGMANITLLGNELLGWDSGCGNVLLDYWIKKSLNKRYDENGEFARSGRLHQELFTLLLHDKYFKRTAPKSTGREYFNATWLESKLSNFACIKPEDVQRTLLELTVKTIANDIEDKQVKRVILCGGGAKNSFLVERLEALCSASVTTTDTLGVDAHALEAMAFAWLAYKRIHKEEVELRSVTGAKKNSLLGAIYG